MTDRQPNPASDEAVYEATKGESPGHVVYDLSPELSAGATSDHDADTPTTDQQEAAVADSFPASDPVPAGFAVPAKPKDDPAE